MLIDSRLQAELELRHRRKSSVSYNAPDNWQEWCQLLFPDTFNQSFADRHIELWEWIESIERGVKPKAFIGIWGRGGAKSTNAETGVVRLGAKETRKFGLYVSSTQLKADGHVQSIAYKIEKNTFGAYYRKMSKRAVNQYGSSKGWRRELLRCNNGFTLQSFGLDTGMRGIKVDDYRPDFIILDDVDELHESLPVTLKKERIITDTILPSGSSDCAVLFVQNLIHPDSIASRLIDNRADFLRNRITSGPFPAITDLVYKQNDLGMFEIISGMATWSGQSLEVCQQQMNEWGLSAFLRESQHDVNISGGLWDHIDFSIIHKNYDDVKGLIVDVETWVDPAVTSTDNSDCMGISCGGKLLDGTMAGLYWWENITTPEDAITRAIRTAIEYGGKTVGVETDNGGDTWRSVFTLSIMKIVEELYGLYMEENPKDDRPKEFVIEEIKKSMPTFKQDKAGSGHGPKVERNQRMMTDYEKGKVFHCIGTHNNIEKSLRRFPNKPLDLADSWYYVWYHLIGKNKFKLRVGRG